jgi:protein SCO1/2
VIALADLDPETPEERIAELADAARGGRTPDDRARLVALLPERLPLYYGRSTNEVVRMRGYVLASFEDTGLPDAALPFVCEELESGRDAYLVAAAAKAVRGLPVPSDTLAPLLIKAIRNIEYMDDAVTFEQYRPSWPLDRHTTATEELFRTLAWLGTHARAVLPDLEAMLGDARAPFPAAARAELRNAVNAIRATEPEPHPATGCCCGTNALPLVGTAPNPVWPSATGVDVELEDQDGRCLAYDDIFGGKPTVAVFFYTRCPNPNKCSLTITKLAALQAAMAAEGLRGRLRTVAITYDPEFDVPARLKTYGADRGVLFDDDHRIVRARHGFARLQERFQLGVNFSGPTVNTHRLELFIVDSDGDVAVTLARLQWDPADVLARARALLRE